MGRIFVINVLVKIFNEWILIESEVVMKFFLIMKNKTNKKIGVSCKIRNIRVCSYYNQKINNIN